MSAEGRFVTRARAVLRSDKISADERIWFEALLRTVEQGRPLKAHERRAVTKCFDDLGLSEDAENLFSSGAAPIGKPVAPAPALLHRPSKPPSRRPPGDE